MNYRETRLKDETGFLWAGIKSDEFLKNSAAIFCKKISSEKAEKKPTKKYLIFLWYFPFGILSEKQTAEIDKRIQNQFQSHLLSLVRNLKNLWSKQLWVIKKEEKDNKQNIDD